MILLALDIGKKHTGWACGAAGEKPRFGTFKMPEVFDEDDHGPLGAAFENWLLDMCAVHRPAILSYEAPFPLAARRNDGGRQETTFNTARIQLGLAFLTEKIARQRRIECFEAHIQTVRAHFCGSGRAQKDDVVTRCVQLGWPVATTHEADAGAVWHYETTMRMAAQALRQQEKL